MRRFQAVPVMSGLQLWLGVAFTGGFLFAWGQPAPREPVLSPQADTENAGPTIEGIVKFRGAIPKSRVPDDAGIRRDLIAVDPATGGWRYVAAYLVQIEPMVKDASTSRPEALGGSTTATIDQRDGEFVPRVLAVRENELVVFTNSDLANHNVRATAFVPANEFNVFTGTGGKYTHRFAADARNRPVRLGCDIHPWMQGWVYVFRDRNFAVSDSEGRFRIGPVLPGAYKLVLEQPAVGYRREQTVTLTTGSPTQVTVQVQADELRPPPAVISRGEAAGTYQAFPDVCRLANGDLLCVFYGGYAHVSLPNQAWPKGGRICLVRSSDEGRTWTAPATLFDGPLDDRDPHVAQLRNGTVVCSFFTYQPGPEGKVICHTGLLTSTDGGGTWDSEPRVVAPGWPSSAPVRELPDGTLVLGIYYADDRTAYGGLTRSGDGGKNWSQPIPIGKDSGIRLDAETDFVLLKDGTLFAALRGDRGVPMHFATSADQGLTWSDVKDIGFPGHCPHFTRLSTGDILLGHRLPQTALHISRDDAKTWLGPYLVDSTPGAYPSTVELKDGSVLIVYYEEGANSAVRARRFKSQESGLEWLPLN